MDFIFKVDPIRRSIKVPDAFTVLTMDHNIHKLVFICPYYEDFAFDSASIVFMVDAPDGKQYSIPAEEYESFPNSPSPYVKFTLTLKSYITSVVGYMSFCITADIISSGNVIEKSWHSKNITISIGGHIDNDDSEDIPEEDVPTINQRLNNLDSKVGRLQTAVNGMSGGVPPIASSTSGMNPEVSPIYVNTTDGNWYYYDGSAWQIGGQYGGATTSTTFNQHGVPADDFAVGEALAGKADADDLTAIEGDVESLAEDIADLKDDLNGAIEDSFEVYPSLRPTLTSGYINANDNSIVASENFGVTAPIAVKKGQIIKLTATGYGTSVGMIATCNADNTSRTTKVRSIDNNEHTYTYTVEEDGYVVCSVKTLYGTDYKLSVVIDYYELFGDTAMYGDILQIVSAGTVDKPIERNISGSYVFKDGTVQQSATMFISQSIVLYPGQTLTFNGRGYNTAVAMISEYDSASDTYTPLVISADSTDRVYTYTASEKVTVRCSAVYYSSGQNVPYSATITTQDTDSIRISTLEDKVNAISTEIIQYPQLFDNILCIGDSLTVGYDGSGDTPLAKNYPHFLRKLTDANTTLKAHGGWTTKQVWDGEISTATDLSTYDCAIIFLGTNGGLTDTVSTDCKADYTQNADTNTGCYGKIIGKIKADAPNCRIFCVAGVNDYIRRATTMNPAVRALAEFYSVGLIDVENCIMSDSGGGDTAERYLYRPIDGIHYNALGYMTLANMFYNAMSEFMSKHLTMYS